MPDLFALEDLSAASRRVDMIANLLDNAEETIGDVLSDDPHMRQLVGRAYDLVSATRFVAVHLSRELSRFAAEAEAEAERANHE